MPGIDIDIQYAIDDNVTTVPSVVCLPPCLWYSYNCIKISYFLSSLWSLVDALENLDTIFKL